MADAPDAQAPAKAAPDPGAATATATATTAAAIPTAEAADTNADLGDADSIKVICLGDSAVGKSKLVERYLMNAYQPHQHSTYALTLFRYNTKIGEQDVKVDFWDTAGQERFNSMHPSYYHKAHACIIVFDVTRKITYKNLPLWYKELRQYRKDIPCICVANKIDLDREKTTKKFGFATKNKLPFYFVSASDGTNVVKVFNEAIEAGFNYKKNPTDFMDEVMNLMEDENFGIASDAPVPSSEIRQ